MASVSVDLTSRYVPIGDLDQDGIVNIEDLILMVQIVLNESDLSDYQWEVGDINHDGEFDIFDIIHLADLLAG